MRTSSGTRPSQRCCAGGRVGAASSRRQVALGRRCRSWRGERRVCPRLRVLYDRRPRAEANRPVTGRRTFLIGATVAGLSLGHEAKTDTIKATLYKDPACGCCSSYANHLRENGFAVEVIATPEFAQVGRKAGVPAEFEGCHTVFIGDYVVSGHVPIEVVRKMLGEAPAIVGLTLPGMPAGSPGMPGPKTEAFTIYAFTLHRRLPTIYATV